MSTVSLVHTDNRQQGVASALDAFDGNPFKNKAVLIKPNFNTADPTPGSTHNDTLLALVDKIWEMGARSIQLGERSYPVTHKVIAAKGIQPQLASKDVTIIDFDKLDAKDWILYEPSDSHWDKGFRIARPIVEAECLVSTCCLKTHQFGGVFTLSLKLHVGVVPTFRNGWYYMGELHQSPYQQEMIAEINQPFAPDVVILDGLEAFVDGGPAVGKRVTSNLFLISDDRVALDAVGVAALKLLGSNPSIMQKKIFDQKQIRRAADLGIGVFSPAEIELHAANQSSQNYRDKIFEQLIKG